MAVFEKFAEEFLLRLDCGFDFGDLFFGEAGCRNYFCCGFRRIRNFFKMLGGFCRDGASCDRCWRGDGRGRREDRRRGLRCALRGTEENGLRRR